MAGKPIRLGKAAGELNVGVSTLVEFLESKGVKIDANPNTKLESEHYDILQKEFAADQILLSLGGTSVFSGLWRHISENLLIVVYDGFRYQHGAGYTEMVVVKIERSITANGGAVFSIT